jgi:hypothetical protein
MKAFRCVGSILTMFVYALTADVLDNADSKLGGRWRDLFVLLLSSGKENSG